MISAFRIQAERALRTFERDQTIVVGEVLDVALDDPDVANMRAVLNERCPQMGGDQIVINELRRTVQELLRKQTDGKKRRMFQGVGSLAGASLWKRRHWLTRPEVRHLISRDNAQIKTMSGRNRVREIQLRLMDERDVEFAGEVEDAAYRKIGEEDDQQDNQDG